MQKEKETMEKKKKKEKVDIKGVFLTFFLVSLSTHWPKST